MNGYDSRKSRCRWCNLKNPLYVDYHDREWGVPVHDDGRLFEMLLLETFQAGLSWECVLNKRKAFRRAFDGFDYRKIAAYGMEKQEALLSDAGIIRHRKKIASAVTNARVFMDIQRERGTFDKYIWGFTEGKTVREVGPVRSPLSDAVSEELRKRGMKFMGSTTVYAFLQAVGIIDAHEPDCWRADGKLLDGRTDVPGS